MNSEEQAEFAQKLTNMRARAQKRLGNRLKEERKRLGLSLIEFSRRLNIHRNTQSNYESGLREPDADYYERIAKLGVSLSFVHNEERLEDAPSFAANIAVRVFGQSPIRSDIDPEGLRTLVYIIAENAVRESGEYEDTFSADIEQELISAAFKDGNRFSIAAEAVVKFAFHIAGIERSTKIWGELILETLGVYYNYEHKSERMMPDHIKLIAERVSTRFLTNSNESK